MLFLVLLFFFFAVTNEKTRIESLDPREWLSVLFLDNSKLFSEVIMQIYTVANVV